MTYPETTYSLGAGNSRQQQQQAAAAAQMDDHVSAQDHFYSARDARYGIPPVQPATLPINHWSIVLGVSPTASKAEINKAYRAKAKLAHADAGGTDGAMVRLNLARDQATKERAR